MQQPMRPYIFNADPSLIERADRVVRASPEYERSRARLIRQAIRELLDRKEAEIAERRPESEAA